MAYLYRQKFNLSELVLKKAQPKTIILAEPEEYLLALYSGYLMGDNFIVKHCTEVELLDDIIIEHSPHLLILSVNFFEDLGKILELLNRIKNEYPFLPVVTTGFKLNSDHLKKIMSAGIVSHIERTLTRPKDISIIAGTILNI